MEYDQEIQALKERKMKFDMLELPGQPFGMHMGTAYLMGDLMRMVEKLAEALKNVNTLRS